MRIGIDLMGSDSSPTIIFDALIQALNQLTPSLRLIALATQSVIDEHMAKAKASLPAEKFNRLTFLPVANFVEMGEDPLVALRQKKRSSTAVGIKLLKKKQIDALVSAGNTGALVASATLSLPKLPGITRPALLAVLPTKNGSLAIVDVGGNVSCKAEHLVKYAYMGAAYQKCTSGIKTPKVGLLNIGSESKKGTSVVRRAYQLLKDVCQRSSEGVPYMEFHGNIEGREVFYGKVDVLVTDGFTGNILVKTSEGLADFIFEYLRETQHGYPLSSLHEPLEYLQALFYYAEYQGALLCGVEGLVIKCHGHSNTKAFFNSIRGVSYMIENNLLMQIRDALN
ncbi:phosphate acyltransferase PlsX [Neochlamydia sp. AcF95]|uniref:phosphate acyltransferase PlsX n=1 Tax=Neochlamydia sp. AcF95 TaxID=2795734 RepID=UPI001BC9460D|nr:phosphate acyltransferase PlsX [Neochlamydia sp. AcF95]